MQYIRLMLQWPDSKEEEKVKYELVKSMEELEPYVITIQSCSAWW